MAAARIRETPPLLSRSGSGGAIAWERSIANRLGGVISVASRLLPWPKAERKGFRALHAEAVIASRTPALFVGTVDASHDDIDAARRAAGVASSSCGEVTRPAHGVGRAAGARVSMRRRPYWRALGCIPGRVGGDSKPGPILSASSQAAATNYIKGASLHSR
jgi:hypothetical protein